MRYPLLSSLVLARREPFALLLERTLETDLWDLLYSAAANPLDTCLGLKRFHVEYPAEKQKSEVHAIGVRLVRLLRNPDERRQVFQQQNNAGDLFLSLWSEALAENTDMAIALALPLLETDKPTEIRFAAARFLSLLSLTVTRRILLNWLNDSEPAVAPQAFEGCCISPGDLAHTDLFERIEERLQTVPAPHEKVNGLLWPCLTLYVPRFQWSDSLKYCRGDRSLRGLIPYPGDTSAMGKRRLIEQCDAERGRESENAVEILIHLLTEKERQNSKMSFEALNGRRLSSRNQDLLNSLRKRRSRTLRTRIDELLSDKQELRGAAEGNH